MLANLPLAHSQVVGEEAVGDRRAMRANLPLGKLRAKLAIAKRIQVSLSARPIHLHQRSSTSPALAAFPPNLPPTPGLS